MKTVSLNILKKNRKYFACKLNGRYDAKLIIDSNSENLELGEKELLVEDRSVRTKYGTDLIFELAGSAEQANSGEKKICTLQHETYNTILLDKCKNLGGRWDKESKTWVFDSIVADQVEELDILFNDDIEQVEITAKKDFYAGKGPVDFCGYVIARAFGRDSGAKLGDNVSQLSGKIFSAGSVKNWSTEVKGGSTFRLRVSKNLLEKYDESENWDFKIL